MINTARPPQVLFRTIPQKFQESSTATTEFSHGYNAEYESQAVKSGAQYKPERRDMEPGENMDE